MLIEESNDQDDNDGALSIVRSFNKPVARREEQNPQLLLLIIL